MEIDIPAYPINISVPVSGCLALICGYLVSILAAGSRGFGALKCQHGVADTTRPPHFVQQEERATSDVKGVLTFVTE